MPHDSTGKPRPRKAADRPKKPYPEFPLSPHPSGKWQKKVRGMIHYFGRWAKRVNGKLVRVEGDGWKEALEEYKVQADDLQAGRTPRVKSDGLTVADLCNRFLTAKQRQREAGEISSRMFEPTDDPKKPKGEYPATTGHLVVAFGGNRLVNDLAADDFEKLRDAMAKRWGPVRLANEIQKVRTVFKYGFESGLIETPVRFGPQFKKPSAGVLRRHRAKSGERMLEAEEIRRLLDKAGVQLKAMLLLGVDAGFGNHDIATLPLTALNLDTGWVNYPRPKTGIPRRCPLWPETVVALRDAISKRPQPRQAEAEGLVFVTTRGRPWLVNGIANPVSVAARNLMKAAGIHHDGIGFYTLRHVFRTVADGTRDAVAIDLIMGHTDSSMGGHYRERIEDSRLKAVTDYVRAWLFGNSPTAGKTDKVDENCSPSESEECDGGSEGSLKTEPVPSADARPLRLYVG